MTRRRPGAAKGGGSPPPETDDFGRERALREGDPPPLPNRETDVFEGPGEGSGAPGDLKSRVHASKSMTCASKCDMESTFIQMDITHIPQVGRWPADDDFEVTRDVLRPPASPSPRARRILSGSREGTPLTLPGARRMILLRGEAPLPPGDPYTAPSEQSR